MPSAATGHGCPPPLPGRKFCFALHFLLGGAERTVLALPAVTAASQTHILGAGPVAAGRSLAENAAFKAGGDLPLVAWRMIPLQLAGQSAPRPTRPSGVSLLHVPTEVPCRSADFSGLQNPAQPAGTVWFHSHQRQLYRELMSQTTGPPWGWLILEAS